MVSDYIRNVNYYETDKMRITNHSNYIGFMEEARIFYLEQVGCGHDKWEADGIFSPVIDTECTYKKPTTFGDEIRVHVELEEYKKARLIVAYTTFSTENNEIVFTGKSRYCFTNNQGRPIILSKNSPFYGSILLNNLTEV